MSYPLERARLDEATTHKLRLLEEDLHCRIVALRAKAHYSELSPDQFAKIEQLERQLGVLLVAYDANDYYRLASLPAHTLERVQQLEEDTGLVFVAYQYILKEASVGDYRPEDGYEVAVLSEDQAEKLERSEVETNLLLMAYRKSKNR